MEKSILTIALLSFLIIGMSFGRRTIIYAILHTKQMATDTALEKIKLEKTTFNDMNILFISDTAATTPDIKSIFGKGYGEIMELVQQNKLQPIKFMAWYSSAQPPWPIDIAVEVNKMPEKMNGHIHSKIQAGGQVLIAHIWGPYDQVGQGYRAIEKWLKENDRKAKSPPFEVYVNDPATVKSPAEIQTDVYQPLE